MGKCHGNITLPPAFNAQSKSKLKDPAKKNNIIGVTFSLLLVLTVLFTSSAIVLIYSLDISAKSKLLYNVVGKSLFTNVYVYYPNGILKTISPTTTGIYYQPHINQQGDKVVFYGNDLGPPQIWIANLKTDEVKALTPKTSGARHPVFSWDGTMIAFASDRMDKKNHERIELMRGNGLPSKNLIINIFTMDTTGQNVRQITFGPYQDQRPAFSPDGKQLAFVSNRNGNMQLWTIRIDGTFEPKPLQTRGWGYRPWFSPDGQWIYFFTNLDQSHRDQICKISINGGPIIPLPNDKSGTSHGPFVDFDNNLLLMHSNRSGKFSIWELPLDGGEPKQITIPNLYEPTSHATRSRNGIIAFDTYRQSFVRKLASDINGYIK